MIRIEDGTATDALGLLQQAEDSINQRIAETRKNKKKSESTKRSLIEGYQAEISNLHLLRAEVEKGRELEGMWVAHKSKDGVAQIKNIDEQGTAWVSYWDGGTVYPEQLGSLRPDRFAEDTELIPGDRVTITKPEHLKDRVLEVRLLLADGAIAVDEGASKDKLTRIEAGDWEIASPLVEDNSPTPSTETNSATLQPSSEVETEEGYQGIDSIDDDLEEVDLTSAEKLWEPTHEDDLMRTIIKVNHGGYGVQIDQWILGGYHGYLLNSSEEVLWTTPLIRDFDEARSQTVREYHKVAKVLTPGFHEFPPQLIAFHPDNDRIYGKVLSTPDSQKDYEELKESIQRAGRVKDRVRVNLSGEATHGNRRTRAAVELGLVSIPIEVVDYQNVWQEKEDLLDGNLQRRKDNEQLAREIMERRQVDQELLKIQRAIAAQNLNAQLGRGGSTDGEAVPDGDSTVQGEAQPKTAQAPVRKTGKTMQNAATGAGGQIAARSAYYSQKVIEWIDRKQAERKYDLVEAVRQIFRAKGGIKPAHDLVTTVEKDEDIARLADIMNKSKCSLQTAKDRLFGESLQQQRNQNRTNQQRQAASGVVGGGGDSSDLPAPASTDTPAMTGDDSQAPEGYPEYIRPKDQWYTPDTKKFPILSLVERYFTRLGLGGIRLDISADPDHRVPAKRHYDGLTKESNGLLNDWEDGYYGNIPFSEPASWVQMGVSQSIQGKARRGVILAKNGVMHNKSTAKWIADNAICVGFWQGRVDFIPGDLLIEWRKANDKPEEMSTSDFDIVLIVFGVYGDYEVFEDVFQEYANTLPCKIAFKPPLDALEAVTPPDPATSELVEEVGDEVQEVDWANTDPNEVTWKGENDYGAISELGEFKLAVHLSTDGSWSAVVNKKTVEDGLESRDDAKKAAIAHAKALTPF